MVELTEPSTRGSWSHILEESQGKVRNHFVGQKPFSGSLSVMKTGEDKQIKG